MATYPVLRYPYEALTDSTDYLQVSILEYSRPSGPSELISSSGSRRNAGDTVYAGNIQSNQLSKLPLNPQNANASKRTSASIILLPMPSNIQDGNSVTYADDTLNGITAAAAGGVLDIMKSADFSNLNTSDLFDRILDKAGAVGTAVGGPGGAKDLILKALAAQSVNLFGGNISIDQFLAREKGEIFNPNMELLFNGVTLRSFKFSFKMTPRNDKEMKQVKNIIRTFKQNMAPRTATSSTFLKTPNIFELTYKKGPEPHPFLHKFKQCALTDMAVNYTGENVYATYADGTPVSMVMDLTFKELEPIYNSDYDAVEALEGVGY